jgi:hypothetical protein
MTANSKNEVPCPSGADLDQRDDARDPTKSSPLGGAAHQAFKDDEDASERITVRLGAYRIATSGASERGLSAGASEATATWTPTECELGSLERVAYLSSRPPDGAGPGTFGHREAFILGLVDGESTLHSIVTSSSLPPEQVVGVLTGFIRDGLITLGAALATHR